MSNLKKGTITKNKIFECSKKLFYEKGYYDTSINDISNAGGINRALISYYFGHKANLAVKVIEEINTNITNEIIKSLSKLDQKIDPLINIAVEFRLYTSFRKTNPNYARFLLQLCQENLIILAPNNGELSSYNKYDDQYNNALTELDKKIQEHCISSLINGIIIMHSKKIIDCSHEYIAEKETEMTLKILGIDKSNILSILEESKKIYEKIAFQLGENFEVIK